MDDAAHSSYNLMVHDGWVHDAPDQSIRQVLLQE
jgi:hypothetical protein